LADFLISCHTSEHPFVNKVLGMGTEVDVFAGLVIVCFLSLFFNSLEIKARIL
jgi:hypothetical protein